MQIRVLRGGPLDPQTPFRKSEDFLSYQDHGIAISMSSTSMGAISCQNEIEHCLNVAGMALAAVKAENEGADAIVIEGMGDIGLIPCREAVKIPVVGMSDVSLRLACQLGRKFGIITAGKWHGYLFERILKIMEIKEQYIGFAPLELQPFFTDVISEKYFEKLILQASIKLIEKDADTIVLGGSYFFNKKNQLQGLLNSAGYKNIIVIDPLAVAIRFARMLVDSKLSHSKIIYATPTNATKVIGYPQLSSMNDFIR